MVLLTDFAVRAVLCCASPLYCMQITIDGDTAISFTEDVIKRYSIYIRKSGLN